MTSYTTLSLNDPRDCCLLKKPDLAVPSLGDDSPALTLMTDFQQRSPISVTATTNIDKALDYMIISGVRLLFVIDSEYTLLGSITSYDIQGEKPMLYLQSKDCRIGICSRSDVEVKDIMTPVSKWNTLRYENLLRATLGDVAHTFRELAQRHLIVVETPRDKGSAIVRGMFSQSDLERALGITLMVGEVANSFLEIERALHK